MTDERSEILAALAKQRSFLRQTVEGLTDEQAERRTTTSALSLSGIIKHVARTEWRWVDFILDGPEVLKFSPESMASHTESFEVQPGETLSVLLDRYGETSRRTAEVVAELPSLDNAQRLPEAPWFPPGARWSGRTVLLHILAETAQHSGHADIIRESLDGAKTMG
ncbi:MAG TPA: DinB family protein [Acidimicrobiales bacterium]|nr:DinB family protein [Acidimicrobiales bacterium]